MSDRFRIVKKLDLAETRDIVWLVFEDAMPTLRADFFVMLRDVMLPSGPPGPLLPSSLDFIRIEFFDHTGSVAYSNITAVLHEYFLHTGIQFVLVNSVLGGSREWRHEARAMSD